MRAKEEYFLKTECCRLIFKDLCDASFTYSKARDVIDYSVLSRKTKELLGDGQIKIKKGYVVLQFIVNQEPDKYRGVGTALVEALIEILIKEELPLHIKLVALGISRGFFTKLGFERDLSIKDDFAKGSQSQNMMIAGQRLEMLHQILLTPSTRKVSFRKKFADAIQDRHQFCFLSSHYENPPTYSAVDFCPKK